MVSSFLNEFRSHMRDLADLNRAKRMQSYLKSDQPFYGVNAPDRKAILKELYRAYDLNAVEYKSLCWQLWNSKYREDMHAALDIIERKKKLMLSSDQFDHFTEYFEKADNWDLLDPLAINVLGWIYRHDRSFKDQILSWTTHENKWIRRSSVLVQIKFKNETDKHHLTYVIEALLKESDFFIRKAIGWALRSYGDTNPTWVKHFVATHPDLSNLSKKEALRKII